MTKQSNQNRQSFGDKSNVIEPKSPAAENAEAFLLMTRVFFFSVELLFETIKNMFYGGKSWRSKSEN